MGHHGGEGYEESCRLQLLSETALQPIWCTPIRRVLAGNVKNLSQNPKKDTRYCQPEEPRTMAW